MAVVVVAGGLGDLGRPITDALFDSGKYEVYIMSRKVAQMFRQLFHDTYYINTDFRKSIRFGGYLATDWQSLPPFHSDRLLI